MKVYLSKAILVQILGLMRKICTRISITLFVRENHRANAERLPIFY